MTDFAVIKTGGKQYLVRPGDRLKIEKLNLEEGANFAFDEVLQRDKKSKLEIGTPFIKGAKVKAKVLKQGRGEKLLVFKYKRKTRYKKKTGHRQPYSEVEILKIE